VKGRDFPSGLRNRGSQRGGLRSQHSRRFRRPVSRRDRLILIAVIILAVLLLIRRSLKLVRAGKIANRDEITMSALPESLSQDERRGLDRLIRAQLRLRERK
jgi:hypothetical protein